jgi:hypothetical protein
VRSFLAGEGSARIENGYNIEAQQKNGKKRREKSLLKEPTLELI